MESTVYGKGGTMDKTLKVFLLNSSAPTPFLLYVAPYSPHISKK